MRLKCDYHTPAGIFFSEALQRRFYLRRMMTVVVVDNGTVRRFSEIFGASPGAGKILKRLFGDLLVDPQSRCHAERGGGIEQIMHAGHFQMQERIDGLRVIDDLRADALKYRRDLRIIRVCDNEAALGNTLCERAKRILDVDEVSVVVKVLLLDIGNHEYFRFQIQKVTAVFARLDDAVLALPRAEIALCLRAKRADNCRPVK